MNTRPEIGRILADFATSVSFNSLPEQVVEEAKLCIADTLAVILAAKNEPIVSVMERYLSGASGRSRVFHASVRASAQDAALANGALAHALDYDDGNITTMVGHPSSPVLPAIMALADELGSDGKDIITAFVLGHEIEGRIGSAVSFEHNRRGWHTTCTLGSFGATAAAAHLLRLNAEQWLNAFGIASSMASGLRQNFGFMTKPLHAGIAARNGVVAAKLAAAGMEASPRAIEGVEGFLDLFSDPTSLDLERPVAKLGETWDVLQSNRKLYPTCGQVHPALDMIIEGMESGQIMPSELEKIRVSASFHTLKLMRYHRPSDIHQARFCIPFCIATALVTGDVTVADFTEERLSDPEIQEMMNKVEVYLHPDLATKEQFEALYTKGKAFTELEAIHHGRPSYRGKQHVARGNFAFPAPKERWERKFHQCARIALQPDSSEQAWRMLSALENTKWDKLAALFDAAEKEDN